MTLQEYNKRIEPKHEWVKENHALLFGNDYKHNVLSTSRDVDNSLALFRSNMNHYLCIIWHAWCLSYLRRQRKGQMSVYGTLMDYHGPHSLNQKSFK